jgi:hypothetical protein
MRRIIIIAVFYFAAFVTHGQDSITHKSYFKSRDFGQYFYSDLYAPITNIGFGAMTVAKDFNITSQTRYIAMVAEPVLGAQLPIYYSKNNEKRWSLSIPISFSTWLDFTEKRTAPILNTDYRFAFIEFNYSHNLEAAIFKNIGFRFIPLFHESTHVGDELTIAKIKDTIMTPRINVSYETYEFAVIVNDSYNQKIKNHSFRLGAKFLWNPDKGYYTIDSLDNLQRLKINTSKRWIEPYFQYQYQNPNGWLSNHRMMFVFSQDFYLRVLFSYPFNYYDGKGNVVRAELPESYHLNINTLVGWKFLNANGEVSNMGVFLKLYLGMNPHGQYRNLPVYPWLGINFIYDI